MDSSFLNLTLTMIVAVSNNDHGEQRLIAHRGQNLVTVKIIACFFILNPSKNINIKRNK